MSRYAENTSVSSDKSRAEIEKTLTRYGADGFMYGWGETEAGQVAVVAFRMCNRQVKFNLPLPNRVEFARTPERGRQRSAAQRDAAYEKAVRQRWRALALVVKAKLEAVETGITCFDDEFMAHIVLPDGQRVGDWMAPQIESAYTNGSMPPLLPGA